MLIDTIKKFCLENYENGYDEFVECYDDVELGEYILDYGIQSLADFKRIAAHRISYREEIKSTAF